MSGFDNNDWAGDALDEGRDLMDGGSAGDTGRDLGNKWFGVDIPEKPFRDFKEQPIPVRGTEDPEGTYLFSLMIGKVEVGHFQEVNGLKSSTTVFEIEEGGVNHAVHKLPAQGRWENLVLRYGVTSSVELLAWRDMLLQGHLDDVGRKDISIEMRNNANLPVRRYKISKAWPVSWEGPSFNSGSSDVAIETLELAHHGLTVERPEPPQVEPELSRKEKRQERRSERKEKREERRRGNAE